VFADGYSEWLDRSGVRKQPYRVSLASGEPFAFAALWESLPVPGDGPGFACTLITSEPREDLAWLHDRMPVILSGAGCDAWMAPGELFPGSERTVLEHVVDEPFVATAVSRAVNRPLRDDDPSLILPVTPPIQDSLF
jgi:putative SOS response-associated peptidase YedK